MILDKFKSFYFPNAMFLSLSLFPPFLPQKQTHILSVTPFFFFIIWVAKAEMTPFVLEFMQNDNKALLTRMLVADLVS